MPTVSHILMLVFLRLVSFVVLATYLTPTISFVALTFDVPWPSRSISLSDVYNSPSSFDRCVCYVVSPGFTWSSLLRNRDNTSAVS